MAGLDLERRVNRAVNAGDERLFLMEEALSVRSLPVAGPRGWWRDRLGFLRSALSSGLQVSRTGIPQVASTTVACFPGNATARYRSARTFFVEHHFQEKADCVGRGALREPRLRPSASWRTWWLRGAWWAVLSFLDWSDRRYTWLGGALVDMQQFMRLRRDVRHVYVFALYDRRQYLLLTFLARHTPFA